MIALALGGVLLSGCQSNPEPPPLDSAASSPSATPSPEVAAPTLPPEAKGTSKAAAKAFVRHWVSVLNYVGPAGDAEPLRGLSDPDCAACSAIADFIDQVREDGGDIEGDGWSVQGLSVVSYRPGKSVVVDVRTLVHPQRVRQSDNSKARKFPGGTRLKTFWLLAKGSSWTVARLDQPE